MQNAEYNALKGAGKKLRGSRPDTISMQVDLTISEARDLKKLEFKILRATGKNPDSTRVIGQAISIAAKAYEKDDEAAEAGV